MSAQRTWPLSIVAVLIAMFGLPMAGYGLELALLGGTPYYFICGLLITISAVQLWRVQTSGFYLFAAALLLTLVWAVYEAGTEFWHVGPRIWLVGIFAMWLCLPAIRRALWGTPHPTLKQMPTVWACGTASLLVLVAMTVNLISNPVQEIPDVVYGPSQNTDDWTAYGASHKGTRYAPHDQITKENVGQLKQVWQAETDRVGRFSGTPIQIEDTLYLCTSQNVMLALDADTGEERWRFDPENATPPYGIIGNCRGVTYYHIPERDKATHCAERIFTATTDARMLAVDKTTGEPCSEFGEGGQISLLAGMGEVKQYYYFVTSPPTVASGALVVGGWVMDNQEIEEPSGVVRGYDPRTGSLLWAWDIGREGKTVMPPEGGYYTRGTPNVWSLTTADDELGLVYVPTGNATPDYFGGHRTEVMDKYASSVVAIDAATGLTRWHFQTTHHDIWDYDVPSQPSLVDLTLDGVRRKAIIVPTKRGEVFMLDRETGELLTEVTEKPVPQSDIAEERTTATQPFSTGMPSFAHPLIREEDMFGVSPFDQMACRKAFLGLRYEGPMTPPSTKGTLLYPGPAGGMNWGSVAIDEQRQLMVVNNIHLPFVIHMVPREENLLASNEGLNPGYGIGGAQRGTPFAAIVQMFSSPISLPCLEPPYGEMSVVDLTTQTIIWRKPNGIASLGMPATAGSVVTAGGLIFNAGIMDSRLRAIDTLTGEELWRDEIRSASDATPMSYVSSATGKQYLLVTVPGAGRPPPSEDHDVDAEAPAAPTGGRVIAYALD
ncbi:MAG: quinate dehydrogenase (quinone) [Candidatus Azotimanducaceae bacterium]|jgi:quinate dehydrogenase (quinone)